MRKRMAMAIRAEMLNLLRSAMSAWMVGKVEAPAKANMMEPKALKMPFMVGAGWLISAAPSVPLAKASLRL